MHGCTEVRVKKWPDRHGAEFISYDDYIKSKYDIIDIRVTHSYVLVLIFNGLQT